MEIFAKQSAAISLFALCASPALGCSVAHIATPRDLVSRAEAILVVRAEEYFVDPVRNSHGRLDGGIIRFSVKSKLKGFSDSDLHIEGLLADSDDPNDRPVPYDFVRPEGRHGDCVAKQYRRGGSFLIFLKGGTPYWSPLAPVNEQITSEADDWVVWVKRQLDHADET
jgi:hypothetical protein